MTTKSGNVEVVVEVRLTQPKLSLAKCSHFICLGDVQK